MTLRKYFTWSGAGLALLGVSFAAGILLARACDTGTGDPVVDSAIGSAPRERAKTDTIVRDADSTIALVARLQDSVARAVRRARVRGDSLAALKRRLAEAATPADTIANLTEQVAACEAQVSELSTAAQTCQAATSLAVTEAVTPLKTRLLEVQARADSIPIYIELAVDAAPCTRDWGLFDVPCYVQDGALVVGTLTGVAIIK